MPRPSLSHGPPVQMEIDEVEKLIATQLTPLAAAFVELKKRYCAASCHRQNSSASPRMRRRSFATSAQPHALI